MVATDYADDHHIAHDRDGNDDQVAENQYAFYQNW